MDKTNLYYYDLPFWEDLTRLGEAMQYAFHGEATSEYDIKNKKYWTDKAAGITKPSVCEAIRKFKEESAEALADSPILRGLLDTYLAVAETKDPEKLKAIYTAFQNLQHDLPFETNKGA